MKVLLVAPNASARMGGEAVLPLHWLRELRARGVDARLLTHARCRAELQASDYASMPITYLEDTSPEITIHRFTKNGPTAVRELGLQGIGFVTGWRLTRAARTIAAEEGIDLIHQVTPVAPRAPGFGYVPGLPFVTGPMNGNMEYPEGFAGTHGAGTQGVGAALRRLSGSINAALPGKEKADLVLVANDRTARGLPRGVDASRVVTLVENGVDLETWEPPTGVVPPSEPTFLFVGRLIHWKAVDLLIDAMADVPARLEIVGDGADRAKLEARVTASPAADRIAFLGQLPQSEVRAKMAAATALVLPSVWECGGAVVLEAMACARPVIATEWGGPCDYITEETGILVPPTSPQGLTEGLAAAMRRILGDPGAGEALGEAGRRRVEQAFSWSAKAEAMLGYYERVLGRG